MPFGGALSFLSAIWQTPIHPSKHTSEIMELSPTPGTHRVVTVVHAVHPLGQELEGLGKFSLVHPDLTHVGDV